MEKQERKSPKKDPVLARFFAYSAFVTSFVPPFALVVVDALDKIDSLEIIELFLGFSLIAGLICLPYSFFVSVLSAIYLLVKRERGRGIALLAVLLNIFFLWAEFVYMTDSFHGGPGAP